MFTGVLYYNSFMQMFTETKLDFDQTVGDEDRFAIRRAVEQFSRAGSIGETEVLENLISDSTIVEGFSDLPFMKQEFISVMSRRNRNAHVMRFPKLKLSYSHYLFHLIGTYEEYLDRILVAEGTISMAMIKQDDGFQFVKIVFFPRMRLLEQ